MSEELNKLKQSNSELREIVNNSWDGIGIIDKNSKFIYINNAFSPILGYTKEEILQSSFTSFINIDYIKIYDDLVKNNLHNKYTSDAQIICNRKDGKKVYLQISLSLMLNQSFFVINAKDITKQISDHEILNKYVISSHTDLNGIITDVSDAFCYISGYDKIDLVGKPHSIVGESKKDQALFANLWSTIKGGNEWSGVIKNTKKNGSPFWVDTKIKPIFNKYGDITGFTSLMFDITNEIVLRSTVAQKDEDLIQKDKILIDQSRLAIMAETLQMIAHEWRQPISVISLQSQKLALEISLGKNPTIDDTLQTLDKIKFKADELSKIIEDFQSFVELKEVAKICNPSDIIEKAIGLFQSKYSSNIDIAFNSKTNIEFRTYFNELMNIILSLLINAKEAIERNKIDVGMIDIELSLDGNFVNIAVSDNGGGISDEILPKIFDPYFSTKASQHGVGLGLYMSKIIVEVHLKGEISAQNYKNGAKLIIKLPIKGIV